MALPPKKTVNKKKSLFDNVIDALTDRDEKAEAAAKAEAAKQAAQDAELKKMAEEKAAQMAKTKAEAEAKKLADEAAKKKAEVLAAQKAAADKFKEELEERKRDQIRAQAAQAAQAAVAAQAAAKAAAEAPKAVTQYTVVSGDTLSGIALHFYGNAARKYWELIHNANKDVIPNASLIKPGQVLTIPELPEELKKK